MNKTYSDLFFLEIMYRTLPLIRAPKITERSVEVQSAGWPTCTRI
jgi:hypothetical protein